MEGVVRKEETVAKLRANQEAADKRADHLESLLETLRKQNVHVKNK